MVLAYMRLRYACCVVQLPQLVRQDTEWVHVVPPTVAVAEDDSLARFSLSIPEGLSGKTSCCSLFRFAVA